MPVRYSSVAIASRYGLGVSGIESRWGQDFPHPSIPALGPNQPPLKYVLGLFPGCKAAGAWRWPPTPTSADVKERVELYLYTPTWALAAFYYKITVCNSFGICVGQYYVCASVGRKFSIKINGKRENKRAWFLTFRRLMSTIVDVPHR